MNDLSLLLKEGKALPLMEEFISIQGEGFHSGEAAYFLRIGGCDVGCSWCDEKESWNSSRHPLTSTDTIIENILNQSLKSVIITGGEPLMYDLNYLSEKLKENNIRLFLETSGSHPLSGTWDWIALSPKKMFPPLQSNFSYADELKVIIHDDNDFAWAEQNALLVNSACMLYLQPEWSRREKYLPMIIDYIQKNPQWKLSVQVHKYLHIP